MTCIFTSDEVKYFSISSNLLINGSGEEVFRKGQWVALLGNFCHLSVIWQEPKKEY